MKSKAYPLAFHTVKLMAAFWFGCAGGRIALADSPCLQALRSAPAAVVLADGAKTDPAVARVKRSWNGSVCSATVFNAGSSPLRVARVDLFDFNHGLPGSTPLYAESFPDARPEWRDAGRTGGLGQLFRPQPLSSSIEPKGLAHGARDDAVASGGGGSGVARLRFVPPLRWPDFV